MSQAPVFHLTRRAAIDLRDIHARSLERWGDATANRYMAELYAVMARAAGEPEIGRLRQRRAAPFLMVPANRHFIVYERIPAGIVVLTILHQVQNIETLIATLTPAFLNEVAALQGH